MGVVGVLADGRAGIPPQDRVRRERHALDRLPFRYVRWVTKSPEPVEKLQLTSTSGRAVDSDGRDGAAV